MRVDTGVAQGDTIPAEFDSMIAKVIAWGADRPEALARLRRALAQTTVVIDGGTTNQGFLLDLLQRPELREGALDTGWLDRLQLRGETAPVRHANVAVLQAAIELADATTANERARFYALARRGRPQADADVPRMIELRHRGERYRIAVDQVGPASYRLVVAGQRIEMDDRAAEPLRAAPDPGRCVLPRRRLATGQRAAGRNRRGAASHRAR